jgi:SNF2-related domain
LDLSSAVLLCRKLRRANLSGGVVYKQGHRIKNSGCKLNAELKHYKAHQRLLITGLLASWFQRRCPRSDQQTDRLQLSTALASGTPVSNKLEELWSLLNFLMPQLFDSADDFSEWFVTPMLLS